MTSGTNIKVAKVQQKTDLDNIVPSPPHVRLDDKAATLEQQLVSLKASFNRERVVYCYVINFFILLYLFETAQRSTVFFAVVASLIGQIALGKWLDFPWMSYHLEKWHDLFFRGCRRWVLGKHEEGTDDTEPF